MTFYPLNTGPLFRPAGIHISESEYPKGFYVAKYDEEGFTSSPRWFPTIEKAQDYATQLQSK